MTPEQIALVQKSFTQVFPVKAQMAVAFYDQLFLMAPETRALFPEDMTAQRDKLAETLAVVVRNLHQFEQIAPTVAKLARSHAAYGVQPQHFGPVGAALVHALQSSHPGGLSEAQTNAWVEAYTVLSNLMIAEMKAHAA